MSYFRFKSTAKTIYAEGTGTQACEYLEWLNYAMPPKHWTVIQIDESSATNRYVLDLTEALLDINGSEEE